MHLPRCKAKDGPGQGECDVYKQGSADDERRRTDEDDDEDDDEDEDDDDDGKVKSVAESIACAINARRPRDRQATAGDPGIDVTHLVCLRTPTLTLPPCHYSSLRNRRLFITVKSSRCFQTQVQFQIKSPEPHLTLAAFIFQTTYL